MRKGVTWRWKRVLVSLLGLAIMLALNGPAAVAQAQEEIRIGVLAPMTGPMAKPGEEFTNGNKLFWEQAGNKAGGRPVKVLFADTVCSPDNAVSQSRRLIHGEKIHILTGPVCGHEAPAAAQVANETDTPFVCDPAGADTLTKWTRFPQLVRTSVSGSQIGHPFGDYLYKELGARNVTYIGQDYNWGHEVTLGGVEVFKQLGGKIAKIIWAPMGTTDYGPLLASIPPDTDAVVAVVVGADRARLLEQWFNFGYDRKFKIYGGYWLHEDALPLVDDRAVGKIAYSLNYSSGINTPENKAFVDAYAKKYKSIPSWMAETGYTSSLWIKTALDAIKGKVEDKKAFLNAMRKAKIKAPRGPLYMDEYDNPVQNVYIAKVVKVKHPILGDVKMTEPVKTYTAVSQFWTWKPDEFMARGPYKR
jgi:branched-chain amino acid transport system substrate-binding protein